jgi:hypothetical protein
LLKKSEELGVFDGGKIYRVTVIRRISLRGTSPFTPFRGVACIFIHTLDFLVVKSAVQYPTAIQSLPGMILIKQPTSEGAHPPCGASIFCSITVSVQQKIQLAICHVANKFCPEQGQKKCEVRALKKRLR